MCPQVPVHGAASIVATPAPQLNFTLGYLKRDADAARFKHCDTSDLFHVPCDIATRPDDNF
jgi:hypothetical protein